MQASVTAEQVTHGAFHLCLLVLACLTSGNTYYLLVDSLCATVNLLLALSPVPTLTAL